MKIAVNTRFLLKNKLEGIGWFTYETLKRIVAAHPEDEFIFFFDRPYDESFVFGTNVTPVVLFPPARHPFLFYVWFEWAVSRALKKYQPDVFLSTDGFLTLSTDVKTVLVVHDIAHQHFPEQVSTIVRWYYNYYMPKFVNKATSILTVSEFSKQDIMAHYDVLDEKITVTCNGCNPQFKPLAVDQQAQIRAQYAQGKDYFIYVGAVHPRKNVHRLIAAFDAFKTQSSNDMKLLIAGRFAWQTGAVKSAYDAAKHQSDIEFLGYVPDVELPKIIASAYAMVYASMFEGFGIPILEAMYCDTAVISSTQSSMPEVAGDAAILVNPWDIEALTLAMKRLYDEPEFRTALIEKGKQQRQLFTWERAAQQVYQALKKVSI